MRRFKRRPGDAELDITSFMNLMIILVPVLLLNMVFSHITVLDLKLPDLGSPTQATPDQPKKEQLEVVIYPDRMQVNYPAGQSLRSVPLKDGQQDFAHLSLVLQEVKRLLADQGVQKRDIFILSQPNTDYQTIVSAMDTVRSFKTLVAASVVNAELFPEVALGDAPVLPEPSATAPAGVTP